MASDPFFYSPVTKRIGRINEFINMSGNVSPYDLIESILLEQHVHYYFRYGLEEAQWIRGTFISLFPLPSIRISIKMHLII